MKILHRNPKMDGEASLKHPPLSFNTALCDDSLTIAQSFGKGTIIRIRLEKGLHLRGWDVTINKPLYFRNCCGTNYGEKFFHITYLLHPETLTVITDNRIEPTLLQKGMNIMLLSGKQDIVIEIDPAKKLQALDISFTASWLKQSFMDASETLQQFIDTLLNSDAPCILFESALPTEYFLLSEVYSSLTCGIKDLLKLKAGTFTLLSGFFNKIQGHHSQLSNEKKSFYYDQMMAVEQLLKEHLNKKLPCMNWIARHSALSETTLKRYFKEMFGKGIYEHYLVLKMDAAKRMLLMKNTNVTEVASQFNYENVSSFIDIFKRHHGVSPGSLRKKISIIK